MSNITSVDHHETNAFLAAAEEMGYAPHQFIPAGSTTRDPSGTLENTVEIGRRGKTKVYKNLPGWSKQAIADLKSGFWGSAP